MAHRLWGGEEITTETASVIFPITFNNALTRIVIGVNDTNVNHSVVIATKSATRFSYISSTSNGTILYIVVGY